MRSRGVAWAILAFGCLATQGRAAETVPVCSWNILRYDPPTDPAYLAMFRIMQAVQPKVILLQEAVDAAGRTDFMVNFPIRYPYSVLGQPAKETVRSHILSIYPIVASGEVFAEYAAFPGLMFERPTIWADLDLDNDRIPDLRVYAAHYKSGDGGTDAATRVNQSTADDADYVALLTARPSAAVFYCGDLNSQVGESPINIISSHLTRLTVLDPNNGSPITRPVSGRTLDHMLHSPALAGRVSGQYILNTATGTPPSPALAGDSAAASDHLTLAATLSVPTSGGSYTFTTADVRLNEVFLDHTGTDTVEFVELTGPTGMDLSTLTVVIIEGDDAGMGIIKRVWSLAGQSLPSDGLYVLGTTATPHLNYSIGSTNVIENGSCTVLLVQGFSSTLNADIDADNNTVEDGPIGTIIDGVGLRDGDVVSDATYYGVPVLGPITRKGFKVVPAGVARKTTGLDTHSGADWCYTSFDVVPPATGTGSNNDTYTAAGPGIPNAYGCAPPWAANACPAAISGYDIVERDANPGELIILQASDAEQNPLVYRVLTAPADSTVTDPLNGESAVGAGTLLAGNQIRFRPAAGFTGSVTLTFRVYDTTCASDPATMTIHVIPPSTDEVVITEILYDPANPEPNWEWVEVTNLRSTSVALKTLNDANNNTPGNLTGVSIPAMSTVILTRAKTTAPTMQEFLDAWGLSASQVREASSWPALNNSGTETITLIAADDTVLDVVAYQVNAGGWPNHNNAAGIYLTRNHISVLANDDGTHWALSSVGLDGAYMAAGGDVGSPGIVPLSGTPICPAANNGQLQVLQGASPGSIVSLQAFDPDTPPANLVYTVLSLPAAGTLTDPANGEQIVTAGGTLAGNQVRYTPPTNQSGGFYFNFQVSDGSCGNSNVATVSIQVTPVSLTPAVIITEIMYDPAGAEPNWEWVELTNIGAGPVNLGTLNDVNNSNNGNLAGLTLAAGNSIVVTRTKSSSPTLAEFLDAWTLVAGQVFQTSSWPSLNNTGDVLTLKDAGGVVLDTVSYQVNAAGWPNRNNSASIYLLPGYFTAADNDAGSHWALSQVGIDGAYAGGVGEVGSPGQVPWSAAPEPRLTAAWSTRTHGAAGSFSVNLLAGGAIEDRGNPISLHLEFDQPIQLTAGNNSLLSTSGTIGGAVVSGSALDAQLSNAGNGTAVQVSLGGVAHASDATKLCPDAICLVILAGDANADRTVNVLDLVTVRNNLNAAIGGGNFRSDVNADGTINVLDLVSVRNALNSASAACP